MESEEGKESNMTGLGCMYCEGGRLEEGSCYREEAMSLVWDVLNLRCSLDRYPSADVK